MGCVTSQFEPSDIVKHCRDRKLLMKAALKYRQELAKAHLAYIQTLKNVGFALRQFAESNISDSQLSSPRTPTTTVFSIPHVSSPPPVEAMSPPTPGPQSSPPPPAAINSPSSSSPPLTKEPKSSSVPKQRQSTAGASPSNPPLHVREPSPQSDIMDMPPSYSLSDMASPGGISDFSTSFFSPSRDDQDDFFSTFSGTSRIRDDPDEFLSTFTGTSRMARSPLPPPSPLPNDSWFTDIFNAPQVPYHLEEGRTINQLDDEEEEPDFEQLQKEEGVPDLEEEEVKEDEPVQPAHMDDQHDIDTLGSSDTENIRTTEAKPDDEATAATVEAEGDPQSAENEVAAAIDMTKKLQEPPTVTTAPRGLTDAVQHIHLQFVQAYKSGEKISQMLAIKMVHHHLAVLEDSPNVFNAITFYWSRKTSPAMRAAYEENVNEAHEHVGLQASHASTLEELYAWEKKLYKEVKQGEDIQAYIDHKYKQFHNLHAKGEAGEVLDIARATLKKLENRLQVALQTIHSVSDKIRSLTDEKLFYHLFEIVKGLIGMWKVMLECHKIQHAVSLQISTLENSAPGDEANEAHRKATTHFRQELERWAKCFQQWIDSQKMYIGTLHGWLQMCHMGPGASVEDSSDWIESKSLVCLLVKRWHDHLQGLTLQEQVVDAISSFATVIHALEIEQSLELEVKKEAERSTRELDRKAHHLVKLERKFVEGGEELDKNEGAAAASRTTTKNTLDLKRVEVDSSKTMAEEDKRRYFSAMQVRKNSTLNKLRENLPTLFEKLVKFAENSVQEYEEVYTVVKNNTD